MPRCKDRIRKECALLTDCGHAIRSVSFVLMQTPIRVLVAIEITTANHIHQYHSWPHFTQFIAIHSCTLQPSRNTYKSGFPWIFRLWAWRVLKRDLYLYQDHDVTRHLLSDSTVSVLENGEVAPVLSFPRTHYNWHGADVTLPIFIYADEIKCVRCFTYGLINHVITLRTVLINFIYDYIIKTGLDIKIAVLSLWSVYKIKQYGVIIKIISSKVQFIDNL
jgi:hypothetical protein